MDSNSFNGILRVFLPSGLAYAVGKGWIGSGSVADISAAVFAIVTAAWSWSTNRPKKA